jgi:hypothetical protein
MAGTFSQICEITCYHSNEQNVTRNNKKSRTWSGIFYFKEAIKKL